MKKKFALHIRNETPQWRKAAGLGAKASGRCSLTAGEIYSGANFRSMSYFRPTKGTMLGSEAPYTNHLPRIPFAEMQQSEQMSQKWTITQTRMWYKIALLSLSARAAPHRTFRHIALRCHLQKLHSYQ